MKLRQRCTKPSPLVIAMAADFAPRHSQGGFVILIQAAVPMGMVFGGLLASQLVRAFGWPAIFVAGGVLSMALAPLLVLLPNAAAERCDKSRQNPVAAMFRDGLAPTTLLTGRRHAARGLRPGRDPRHTGTCARIRLFRCRQILGSERAAQVPGSFARAFRRRQV